MLRGEGGPCSPGRLIDTKVRPVLPIRAGGSLNGVQRYEAAAFIDGRPDILDIWNAVRAETGLTGLSDGIRYLEDLESLGLIAFRSP